MNHEHKDKLFGPDIFRIGEGLPREWVGSKSPVCPSKPRKNKLFGGISREFCRDVPGVPEEFENQEVCVRFLAPIKLP